MNTQFKVGQKVKVITASTGTELNVSGWIGEIIEVQSNNFIGIRFENYPLLYCFSDEDITLNVEILHLDADKPVMWRKIDKNNLPQTLVGVNNRNEDNPQVYTGFLHLNDANGKLYIQSIGGYVRLYDFTHYIPLSDLINLPIQA
jgi:hypothetical protein